MSYSLILVCTVYILQENMVARQMICDLNMLVSSVFFVSEKVELSPLAPAAASVISPSAGLSLLSTSNSFVATVISGCISDKTLSNMLTDQMDVTRPVYENNLPNPKLHNLCLDSD